jgi:hypothetical protein
MWAIHPKSLTSDRGLRFTVTSGGIQATCSDVISAWRASEEFRSLFNAQLANAPYRAFRWETPSVTRGTINQPFECVVLDSPSLDRRPDGQAFAEFFVGHAEDVVAVPNLNGDAILVIPQRLAEDSAYVHLATFVRQAPDAQRHALWQQIAESMLERLSDKPIWLSTAGAGVAWLHVRLDDRPKYYGFGPYRSI